MYARLLSKLLIWVSLCTLHLISKCSDVLHMYVIAYQLLYFLVIFLMPMVLVKFDVLGWLIVKPNTFSFLGFNRFFS